MRKCWGLIVSGRFRPVLFLWRRSLGGRLLTCFAFRCGRQDHEKTAPLHIGTDFDFAHISEAGCKVFQYLECDLGVLDFTAAEAQTNFDFRTAFQEFTGLADTNLCVMFAGFGTQADFFDLHLLLRFTRLTFPFGLFVLIFAVVDKPADRGVSFGSDFDQIEITLLGQTHGLGWGHDAQLFSGLIDHPNFGRSDLFIDANARRPAHISSVATFPLGYVALLLSLLLR